MAINGSAADSGNTDGLHGWPPVGNRDSRLKISGHGPRTLRGGIQFRADEILQLLLLLRRHGQTRGSSGATNSQELMQSRLLDGGKKRVGPEILDDDQRAGLGISELPGQFIQGRTGSAAD